MNSRVLLVAEDDDMDAMLLELAVKKAGDPFELRRVATGEEAVAYIRGEGEFADRKQHPWPQVLLLDLKMPRGDGFDVLQWLRNHPTKPLPAIVLSSSALQQDVERAYNLGASSYVVKPTAPERLEEMVHALRGWWDGFNVTLATQ